MTFLERRHWTRKIAKKDKKGELIQLEWHGEEQDAKLKGNFQGQCT